MSVYSGDRAGGRFPAAEADYVMVQAWTALRWLHSAAWDAALGREAAQHVMVQGA